ncbi:Gcv operon activator [Hartmannibacter diazotrophicus]|uniref:Gcv operon activator n=1 Tax=Hartmannibacter diazotrophicus TaxID=1482074 RepID=A0A2C9D421_9HYPH|nr:LysR substrate-binding domain-containing protein [Hartmannibacter diazotrophicus]SON54511.1 Gcv operon activator [Hartmannibacter diazotrophicus]
MRDLNQVHLTGLRALEAVGRLGSLPAAADELGVSVGAVSQQVIKAERQLGLTFFERTPRGMEPTEAARPLLARLSNGFGDLAGVVSAARRTDSNILTISIAPILASRWLLPRLDRFTRQHPDISLRLDASARLVDPSHSDVDLCIRIGPGSWPNVRAEFFLEQLVFPVCAPGLLDRIKTPSDLLTLPAIVDGNAMFDWGTWMREAGLGDRPAPSVRHVFSEASLCLDAVISGEGVMLGWQTLVIDAVATGCLAVPFPAAARTGFGYYFVTAPETRRSAKVEAFKAWMRRELEESLSILKLSSPD